MEIIEDYEKLRKEVRKIAQNMANHKIVEIIDKIIDIDQVILKSPKLLQDTCLVRYGSFFEHMCHVGEVFSFEGFLSASYDDITKVSDATKHFADKPHRWKMIFLVPEGTPGTRLNDQFNALTTEREWLLQRDQKFEVLWYGKTVDPLHPSGERDTVVLRIIN